MSDKNLGYVKIWNTINDNDLFKRDFLLKYFFIEILLRTDKNRGYTEASIVEFSNSINVSIKSINSMLRKLERNEIISLEVENDIALISVLNWSKFQNIEEIEQNDSNYEISMKNSKQSRKEEKIKLETVLIELMGIINVTPKVTDRKVSMLRARIDEGYTNDEIIAAAKEFAKSDWHIKNKQMSIENLLAPTKFGKWFDISTQKKTRYVGDYSNNVSKTINTNKELTKEQKDRGALIKKLIKNGMKMSEMKDLKGKTNNELEEIILNLEKR